MIMTENLIVLRQTTWRWPSLWRQEERRQRRGRTRWGRRRCAPAVVLCAGGRPDLVISFKFKHVLSRIMSLDWVGWAHIDIMKGEKLYTFYPPFFLLNLTYMKRILHLVSVKNITFKSSYNWFKIDIFRLADRWLPYSALFRVTSTTIYVTANLDF